VNVEIASVYLGLGEKEKALEWLDKASESEDEIAYLLDNHPFKMEPLWDSLHQEPRLRRLLEKLHLE